MRNQKTLEYLYGSAFETEIKMEENFEETELYHHGVLGMSWGKRHGPPYPLTGVDKKVARAEAKRKREKERQLKKARRAATKKRKEIKREAKKEESILKKKQKLLKEGDIEKIQKNAKLFTNDEMRYAMERNALIEEQKKQGKKAKVKEIDSQSIDNLIVRLGQMATIAASVGTIANQGLQVKRFFDSFKNEDFDKQLKELDLENKQLDKLKKQLEIDKTKADKRKTEVETIKNVNPELAKAYVDNVFFGASQQTQSSNNAKPISNVSTKAINDYSSYKGLTSDGKTFVSGFISSDVPIHIISMPLSKQQEKTISKTSRSISTDKSTPKTSDTRSSYLFNNTAEPTKSYRIEKDADRSYRQILYQSFDTSSSAGSEWVYSNKQYLMKNPSAERFTIKSKNNSATIGKNALDDILSNSGWFAPDAKR